MKIWFGKIENDDCFNCGSKATHSIKRKSIIQKSKLYYCKICWLEEISKILDKFK